MAWNVRGWPRVYVIDQDGVSNVRQLTMAWLMYANDYKGHFCSAETQNKSTPPGLYDIDYSLGVTNGSIMDPKRIKPGFWSWIADGSKTHDIPSGMIWPYVRDL